MFGKTNQHICKVAVFYSGLTMLKIIIIFFTWVACSNGAIIRPPIYEVTLYTGHEHGASIRGKIFVTLFGNKGVSNSMILTKTTSLGVGSTETFIVNTGIELGIIHKIIIKLESNDQKCDWFLKKVTVHQLKHYRTTTFPVSKWLSIKNSAVEVNKREEETCGITFRPRVINGKEPWVRQWPWITAIKMENTPFHICGGTLIHPEWVVTAAHCVSSSDNMNNYKIVLGEHNLKQSSYEQIIRPKEIIVHPQYNTSMAIVDYDMALIHLERPALMNSYAKLACLSNQDEQISNVKDCWLAGWGKKANMKHADILQHAKLPIVTNNECRKVMKDILPISDKQVCAGGNHVSGCLGDSGSPLVCMSDSNYKWYLQGVVTGGSADCSVDKYSVFQRVNKYIDWIESYLYSKYIH